MKTTIVFLFTALSLTPSLSHACGCDMIAYSAKRTLMEKKSIQESQIIDDHFTNLSIEFNWKNTPHQGGSDVELCYGIYSLQYHDTEGRVCKTTVQTNLHGMWGKITRCRK